MGRLGRLGRLGRYFHSKSNSKKVSSFSTLFINVCTVQGLKEMDGWMDGSKAQTNVQIGDDFVASMYSLKIFRFCGWIVA